MFKLIISFICLAYAIDFVKPIWNYVSSPVTWYFLQEGKVINPSIVFAATDFEEKMFSLRDKPLNIPFVANPALTDEENAYECIITTQVDYISMLIVVTSVSDTVHREGAAYSENVFKVIDALDDQLQKIAGGDFKARSELATMSVNKDNMAVHTYLTTFNSLVRGRVRPEVMQVLRNGINCNMPDTKLGSKYQALANSNIPANLKAAHVEEVDPNTEYRDNLDPRDSGSEPVADTQHEGQLHATPILPQQVANGNSEAEFVEGDSGEEEIVENLSREDLIAGCDYRGCSK